MLSFELYIKTFFLAFKKLDIERLTNHEIDDDLKGTLFHLNIILGKLLLKFQVVLAILTRLKATDQTKFSEIVECLTLSCSVTRPILSYL